MIPKELTKEIIYGEVVAKANHYMAVPDKDGQRRIIKDPLIREYERHFCKQVTRYRNKLVNARFALYCDVYYCNPRHDLDNSLKTVLDCLQYAKVITNDSLCVEIHATKHRAGNNPRVEYAIKEFEPNLM